MEQQLLVARGSAGEPDEGAASVSWPTDHRPSAREGALDYRFDPATPFRVSYQHITEKGLPPSSPRRGFPPCKAEAMFPHIATYGVRLGTPDC